MPSLHTALRALVTVSATLSTFRSGQGPGPQLPPLGCGPVCASAVAPVVFGSAAHSRCSQSCKGAGARLLPTVHQSVQAETRAALWVGAVGGDGQGLGCLATDPCFGFPQVQCDDLLTPGHLWACVLRMDTAALPGLPVSLPDPSHAGLRGASSASEHDGTQ